jgi:hypothetical protein
MAVPPVVRLHLADDAQRTGADLPLVEPKGRGDLADRDLREEHAQDRQVVRHDPRGGGLHRFGVWRAHLGLARGDRVDRVEEHPDRSVLGDDGVGLGDRGGNRERVADVRRVEHDTGWLGALLEAKAGAEAVPRSVVARGQSGNG